MGDFLSFSSVTVSFSNFAFVYGAGSTPSVNGTVTVIANNVVLFPSVSFLDVKLGNLTGSYDFDAPGFLTFSNVNMTIPIGNALTITLTGVSLTPDAADGVIASGSATLTSSLFTGLPALTINNFQVTKTGISFYANLTATDVGIGDFLSFTSVTLVASADPTTNTTNPFVITTSPTFSVTGGIGLVLNGMKLFPGDSAITLSGSVSAVYDFGSATSLGGLTITITSFSLTIENEITLSADTVHITPDQSTLATVTSARPGNCSPG